jgi:hypothetical protein
MKEGLLGYSASTDDGLALHQRHLMSEMGH